ncbi:Lcl domain-containing protein [Ferruginibacter sp.]
MKKSIKIIVLIFFSQNCFAQNVGIGTTVPLAKLHVSQGASGNTSPFSPLAVEGNGNTYINLLSPNANETALLFGKASNAASGGIVYNNAGTLNGLQFRTNGNSTKMVLDQNGYLGIGNNAPNAPLSFPPALGKKITLYPGATGDVGFGVSGNRLQIYSDNPNADVAIGYDAGGTFNETFAVKPNGALAVNGNTGLPGQALVNNGAGVPQWTEINNTSYFIGQATQGGVVFWLDESGQHGLVCSTIDQDILTGGPGVKWWTNGPFIFTNRIRKDGIYIGQLNTDSILARHDILTGDIAAAQCARWLGGSLDTPYGDWYLPSLTELIKLRTQSAVVTQVAIFPFANALYWSSTEVAPGTAWAVNFGSTNNTVESKSNLNRVRAIRRF